MRFLPRALRLLGGYPNPFNPHTTIAYELPEAGPVELAVYAPSGQRVRRLVAAPLPAGRHAAAWDGRDDKGREVASGVYLCRLQAGSEVRLGKLVRAK